MNTITESKFHIGDIVQLKAASKAYGEKIPHMVIREVVKEKIDGTIRYKCHCIWFIRSKVWEFKDAWLTENILVSKNILDLKEKKTEKNKLAKREIANITFLKNVDNEFEIVPDEKGDNKEVPTKFCSPALTIIGFENVKNQAPTFDSNSKVIREVPTLLVKCLYFNPIANKYSEVLLPLEVLLLE